MAEEQQVTTEAAEHSKQIFTNAGPDQSKQYVDDQIYVHSLAQQYLNKIETDAEKAKFVTFSRGIIAEVETSEEGAKVSRSGKYTYKQVFDLAWSTLYPAVEEGKEEEPKVEATPVTPSPATPPPNRRSPGDIQVDEGEEMEGYDEQLGLQNYVDAANELRLKTKTLKNQVNNQDAIYKKFPALKRR